MKKVTKNPKIVEAGKKGYEARLLGLKEEVPSKDGTTITTATKVGTTGTTTATIAGTTGTISGSSTKCITTDVYMYDVRLLAIAAVGLSIFYTFKKQEATQALPQAENYDLQKQTTASFYPVIKQHE